MLLVNIEQQIQNLVNEIQDDDPLSVLGNAIANQERDYLNSAITECNDCSINCGIKSTIRGDLQKAYVLVISDYPVQQQLDLGENFFPFEHTDNFDNLNELFGQYINLDAIVWIDSVCCCPYHEMNGHIMSRPPTSSEANNCKVFVQRLFDIMRITRHLLCIITMGNIALNALIPDSRLEKVRGSQLSYSDTPVFPTYNPNCIMGNSERDENKRENFCNDIANALNWVVKNYPDVI